MISAFTNIFKIPELRQRDSFTVAMLVIVRIGAAITIPGVNAHVFNEWFQTRWSKSAGGRCGRALQYFCRWRAGALRHIFSWDHALHQRIDHDAAADGGDTAAE